MFCSLFEHPFTKKISDIVKDDSRYMSRYRLWTKSRDNEIRTKEFIQWTPRTTGCLKLTQTDLNIKSLVVSEGPLPYRDWESGAKLITLKFLQSKTFKYVKTVVHRILCDNFTDLASFRPSLLVDLCYYVECKVNTFTISFRNMNLTN